MAIGFNQGFSILKQTVRDFDYSRTPPTQDDYTKAFQTLASQIDFDATFVNTLLDKYYSDSIVQGIGTDVLIQKALQGFILGWKLGGIAFPPRQRIFRRSVFAPSNDPRNIIVNKGIGLITKRLLSVAIPLPTGSGSVTTHAIQNLIIQEVKVRILPTLRGKVPRSARPRSQPTGTGQLFQALE